MPPSHARAPPPSSHPAGPYRDGPLPPRDELRDSRGPPPMPNAPPLEQRGPDHFDSRAAHSQSHPPPHSLPAQAQPHGGGGGDAGSKRRRDEFEPPPPDPAHCRDAQGRGWRGSGGGGGGGGGGYQQQQHQSHASNHHGRSAGYGWR